MENMKIYLMNWGFSLKRFPSSYCVPSKSLFWMSVPVEVVLCLPPLCYVGCVWANMPLCFIGLQIKNCTWGTTSGSLIYTWTWFRWWGLRLFWCCNGLRLWRSWGEGVVYSVYGNDMNWGQRANCVTLYYAEMVIIIFSKLSSTVT